MSYILIMRTKNTLNKIRYANDYQTGNPVSYALPPYKFIFSVYWITMQAGNLTLSKIADNFTLKLNSRTEIAGCKTEIFKASITIIHQELKGIFNQIITHEDKEHSLQIETDTYDILFTTHNNQEQDIYASLALTLAGNKHTADENVGEDHAEYLFSYSAWKEFNALVQDLFPDNEYAK